MVSGHPFMLRMALEPIWFCTLNVIIHRCKNLTLASRSFWFLLSRGKSWGNKKKHLVHLSVIWKKRQFFFLKMFSGNAWWHYSWKMSTTPRWKSNDSPFFRVTKRNASQWVQHSKFEIVSSKSIHRDKKSFCLIK